MPPTIVVVEDQMEILELFQELLTTEGYRVATYAQEPVDLEEIKQIEPALLLLDYLIGSGSAGWELLQQIKQDPDTAGIPLIVCTAAIDKIGRIATWTEHAGITVILKPFDIEELLAAVRRLAPAAPGHAEERNG